MGSGASHLVSGHFDAHHTLEQALAEVVGKPAALNFSTGYMANLGVVQAMCFLAGANSMFYGDQLLTTGNPDVARDRAMLDKLGMYPFTENH